MDTSLDSYIKDKGIRFPGRGRGGRGAGGRGNSNRGGSFRGNRDNGGGFGGRPRGGMIEKRSQTGMSSGSTLYISNLDYGVSNQDIGELFSEFGDIRKFAVHFDEHGRSMGTADVQYVRPASAMEALRKYNGVPLDGRAMRIEISGGMSMMSGSTMRDDGGSFGRGSMGSRRDFGGYGSDRQRGGGFRGSRGGQRGRGRGGRQPAPSKEDLDAELDSMTKSG
ncbi:THO complex subunit 4-like [Convolutriloba macropyga]|uniref:THO complex subunit 4-like n=1 Tax=Convolutriloba macropyga TaxID=536237 RepID=UPI003F520752